MVRARFESIWRFVTPATGGLWPLHISPVASGRKAAGENGRWGFPLPDFVVVRRRGKRKKTKMEGKRRPHLFIGSIRSRAILRATHKRGDTCALFFLFPFFFFHARLLTRCVIVIPSVPRVCVASSISHMLKIDRRRNANELTNKRTRDTTERRAIFFARPAGTNTLSMIY